MVAIVTGLGPGIDTSSGWVLGSRGQLGNAAFGRYGENVYVNAANGNLAINRTDEVLIGLGPDDVVERSYNSLAGDGYNNLGAGPGGTGDNWQLSASRHITGLTGTLGATSSTITRVDWDGSRTVYTWNASWHNKDGTTGAYVSTDGPGAYDALTYASNVWTWTDGSTQLTETYGLATNPNGSSDPYFARITATTDTDGNKLTYTYVGSQLTRISTAHASGNSEHTDFGYTGTDLTSVVTTLSDGTILTRVRYSYDSHDRLQTITTDLTPNDNSVTDGAMVVTTYSYDDQSGLSDRVNKITQTGGAELDIQYDSSGRVTTLTQTISSGVTSTTTFSYDTTSSPGNTITSITDALGNITKLTSNSKGQLIEMDLPPTQSGVTGQVIKYTYDANGNVLTAKDALNHTTNYEYDSNGNLTRQHDAAGNVIDYYYDPTTNALLTETHYLVPDPDSYAAPGVATQPVTTYYAYDAENHLRFIVGAQGDVTEYQYDSFGRRVATIAYANEEFGTSTLGTDQTSWASTINTAVHAITDLGSIHLTKIAYDARGGVSSVTTYSTVTTSSDPNVGFVGVGGSNPLTTVTYVYDQFGKLCSRQTTATSNVEQFFYDGLGRLVGSVDLTGARTNITYTDGTNTTLVTLANNETQTSIYNDAGELVSYAQVVFDASTGQDTTATTNYKYDKLGNLIMVTDASGKNIYYLYDAVGRKVADIAGDGSMTEYFYDAANRLVQTVGYNNLVSAAGLQSLAQAVTSMTDVQTSIIRPALSTDSTKPDHWEWRIYDKADRLIEIIDGNGDATVFAYDGMSNLVSTTSYANLISPTTIAGFQTTIPTAKSTPTVSSGKDNVTRNFYDNDGRLIGVLDGNGYLSQIIYDDAGEKTQTVAFATITNSSLRAAGVFTDLLASVGTTASDIHNYYVYDDQGQLRYTLDDNLRPTAYNYDWGGHLVNTIEYAPSIAAAAKYDYGYVYGQLQSAPFTTDTNTRRSYLVHDTATGQLAYSIDASGGVTGYEYDAVGNVFKQISYGTQYITTSNPTQSMMISWAANPSRAHAADDRVTYTLYDLAGRLTYVVDAEGYATEYGYDKAGRKTLEIRYADVYSVDDTASVDNLTTLIGTVPPSTAVTYKYSYDAAGRLSDSFDGLNVQTHYTYDGVGRVLSKTIAPNTSDSATVSYTYDNAGRLASETQASGTADSSTTYYTYDGLGRLLTKKDGNGNITTYTYDSLGHVLTVTVPLNLASDGTTVYGVTTNVYDAFGNLVKSTSSIGGITYYFYDSLNRLVLQIDADTYATATTYTIGGAVASVMHYSAKVTGTITVGVIPTTLNPLDPDNATTTFTRDKLDRVTQVTDAEGFYEKYTLDAFGDRVAVWKKSSTGTIQLGGETVNVFDHRGLLVSETLPITSTQPDGTAHAVVNTFQYDARGNRIQMVEASGLIEQRTTSYVYDQMDRLTQTIGDSVRVIATDLKTASTVAAPTTTLTYDKRGNVIQIKNAASALTYFYYDDLNRKTAEVNAVGTLSYFNYDDNGNLTSQIVYGDIKSSPPLGGTRPAPVSALNCRETDYTYDFNNRLLTTSVVSSTAAGAETVPISRTGYNDPTNGYTLSQAGTSVTIAVSNTYDKSGNLIEQTDGDGNNVWYFYDKLGRKTAQVDQELYLTTYTLDADGNVTTEKRFANRVSTAPTSPPSTTIPPVTADPTNDRVTNFTYDKNGRRLTETRTGVKAYWLNSAGTLQVASTSSTVTYTYNGLGEVLSKKEATLDLTSYAYDAEGRLISTAGPSFADENGVTVQGVTTEFYDGVNNLTQTDQKGSDGDADRITTYTYGYNNDSRLDSTQQNGGRLLSITDATSFVRTYEYDVLGRTMKESFVRITNGTSVTQANAWQYDKLGRTIFQSVATWNATSGNWGFGDQSKTTYDTYGEVTARGVNGVYPETYLYDGAGRVIRSTADDGTVKLYVYDANGNQTLEITSDGNALPSGYDWSSITVDQALTLLTAGAHAVGTLAVAGMVVTITAYDKRGQAMATIEPLRQVSQDGSAVVTNTITASRTYNAFGEVATQTDGNGNLAATAYSTTFVYNTMGKIISQINPLVSYTDEQGQAHNQTSGPLVMVSPTQNNYYDLSGRLIGVRDANNYSGQYDTQNLINTRTLLAGTGYDGSDPTVLKEFHADTGTVQNKYDVFGELRQSINEVGKTETYYYDAMGRLTQQTHQTRPHNTLGNDTSSDITLIDYYAYDGLGERIKHWNNYYLNTDGTPSASDTTWYDMQGRVTNMTDMGGNQTTYAYTWQGTLATTGLGTFGGWKKVTSSPAMLNTTTHYTETEYLDYFGRTVDKTDFGGHDYNYTFNAAGELVAQTNSAGQNLAYTYYNTGLQATESSTYDNGIMGETTTSTYRYDANGNRTFEGHSATGYITLNGQTINLSGSGQSATVTWDVMNRMTQYADSGITNQAPVTINWQYDLNGNIRYMKAQYGTINAQGVVSPTDTTTPQEYWYLYDAMNRFTVTKGVLVTPTDGSTPYIWQGLNGPGMALTYNKDGTRATMTQSTGIVGYYTYNSREDYYYSADGYLVQANDPGSDGLQHIRAKYIRDSMGRVTEYHEYDSNQNTIYERYNIAYNSKSQETSEQDYVLRSDGSYWSTTTMDYKLDGDGNGVYTDAADLYQGGAVTHQHTTEYHVDSNNNVTWLPTSDTVNTFEWWDAALASTVTYQPDVNVATKQTSRYYYDANGYLQSVRINDGNPRTVSFANNAEGEILSRNENPDNTTSNPKELHFYFNGIQVGDVSNNGTSDVDYVVSIAEHTMIDGNGPFRNGNTYATSYADFDQSYDPVNGYDYQSTSSRYTIQAGDTLQSIAQQLWGDSSFWYMIADANGLNGSETLSPGVDLIIPNKVHNIHNSSDTYRVYDPNKAMGDLSPTTPDPPAPPKHASSCAIFGAIIVVIIAVVVSVVSYGTMAPEAEAAATAAVAAVTGASAATAAAAGAIIGGMAAGMLAGVAASVVSQGAAMLMGMQKSLNWKAVAESGIAGMVSGGLEGAGAFGGGGFVNGALRGITGNVISQGIDMAAGLQQKFDWAGVATAGITSGVAGSLSGTNLGLGDLNKYGIGLIAGTAGALVGAGARTLISGTDFGDNILATLPSVIGSTIGSMISDSIAPPAEAASANQPTAGAGGGMVGDDQNSEASSFAAFLRQEHDYYSQNAGDLSGMTQVASNGSLDGILSAGESSLGQPGNTSSNLETVVVSAPAMTDTEKFLFDFVNAGSAIWNSIISPAEAADAAPPQHSHNGSTLVEPNDLPTIYRNNLQNRTWVNPTGSSIRGVDPRGNGAFGATRSDGTAHGGADWDATPGQPVVSPTNGTVQSIMHYNGFTGVQIGIGNGTTVELLYVAPTVAVGDQLSAGDVIGTAQDIHSTYGTDITNHTHVQIKVGPTSNVVDPTPLIPHS